jgi:hypothetical protein
LRSAQGNRSQDPHFQNTQSKNGLEAWLRKALSLNPSPTGEKRKKKDGWKEGENEDRNVVSFALVRRLQSLEKVVN